MPLGAWGPPVPVIGLNTPRLEDDPSLTADMLELFFASNRATANAFDEDIYVAKRTTLAEPFQDPTLVDELSDVGVLDSNVEISADGLTVTFTSARNGNDDLWISTRDTRTMPWKPPAVLASLNSGAGEFGAVLTVLASGEHEVVLCTRRDGHEGLYASRKAPLDPQFPTPMPVDGVNTPDHECDGMRPDEQTLYFTRAALATPTQVDLFRARWDGSRYVDVEPITELNTGRKDSDPWVSPDHRTIYFSREGTTSFTDDLYMATR
jgi:dipeptidyl aminopeptidase/acylaminoacyl peptidase